MQFLKTLLWVVLAVALVLFASNNWTVVTLNLWGGLQADVKLPVLVIAAFLLGLLPTMLIYGARNWSLRRRLENQGPVAVDNAPPVARNAPPPPETVARTNS